jgi:hypothetical protein
MAISDIEMIGRTHVPLAAMQIHVRTDTAGPSPLPVNQTHAGAVPGAAPFVWGIWTVMVALALIYVAHYGSRVPYLDDWVLIPRLTGADAVTPRYLWEQHNEHRIPLPKLVLHILDRMANFDFRAGLFLNVALLAGLALVMVLTVRRIRGRLQFSDTFFPLLLLSLGQCESLLIQFALNLVAVTFIAGLCLASLVSSGPSISASRAVFMATCLALLPLFGASGLIFVLVLAPWLAIVGMRHIFAADAPSRRRGYIVLFLVAVALVVSGLYFIGFHLPRVGQGPVSLRSRAACAMQMLGMIFGGSYLWPASGWLAGAAILATGALAILAWQRRPQDRLVLLGFLAFLAGTFGIVGAVAWGRTGLSNQAGFAPRYATVLMPLGCWLYLAWCRFGSGTAAAIVQMVLFAGVGVFFAHNCEIGVGFGRVVHARLQRLEDDIAAGIPLVTIAERRAGEVFPRDRNRLLQLLTNMRDARVGGFRARIYDAHANAGNDLRP